MLTLSLPIAPTSNNAFVNRTGGKGYGRIRSIKYKIWLEQADSHYTLQGLGRVKPVMGPYTLQMVFPDTIRGDIDGRQKLIIDWLVSRNLVQGDSPKFLRKLESEFSANQAKDMVQITVREADAGSFVSSTATLIERPKG